MMQRSVSRLPWGVAVLAVVLAGMFVLRASSSVAAEDDAAQRQARAARDETLEAQIQRLRAKVLRLEQALKRRHQVDSGSSQDASGGAGQRPGDASTRTGPSADSKPSPAEAPGKGRAGMKSMGHSASMKMGMGGQMKGRGKDGAMGAGSKGGKGMEGTPMRMRGWKGEDGLKMMGRMRGMDRKKPGASLPGFPGAAHIYHIGATGFFLDHPGHITLTPEQEEKLSQIKERALLEQAAFERKIAEAEQRLWTLTGSDQPDLSKIEAQVREIERLRGDKRLAFIRAVGQAASVLTDEQRNALIGLGAPSHAAPEGGSEQSEELTKPAAGRGTPE